MILSLVTAAADTGTHIRFEQLGLNPAVFTIGWFSLKWYSIAYITGIIVGWWYLLKLIAQPGAPMARRHADDLVFYATLGVILGGRLGYVIFYSPDMFLEPWRILRLWDGGMSFHGGTIGTSIGLILFSRNNKLDWLRVHDYVACTVPFGLFFGRLANFVNGELWGKPADLPWAIIFPHAGPLARHPSQLYEAGLEGLVLFAILWWAFWRTKARYQPGLLVGIFTAGYGIARFLVEYCREPDAQFAGTFIEKTGIQMGQWLCVPMIAGGAYLILTAKSRRHRIESIAGAESVA
ncbi:MAG: prolipoprotein diacylglyceryl transferase [Sphingomonas sp.]|uniref:prolipoprotein diacylglyceryl transferase n=1 Tax=Sphingomonas sp. TaxID=28214 RepID=UPI0025F39AE0|nr:prolipoprotein diacylglyceryl transferase [Sphingomonas sp.]MBY0284741.1 prolipoprotein diacylglyceryl transferase [Sphingomonas sp.]